MTAPLAAAVSAMRSDIAALRSAVKLFDGIAEDYRECPQLWQHLCLASQYAAHALAYLRKCLPEEPAEGGAK